MALSIGIVGLPNVGKSTLLNALTGAHSAAAANYPFCTVEPNHAIVAVPDERLGKIAELTRPQKVTPTTIEFVDIAGLVKGASHGEGLGNQFLANIGDTDALLHVVRCFSDENVAHVPGNVDPVRDIETVETELLLRDIQALESTVRRMAKQVRNEKSLAPVVAVGRELLEHVNAGAPVVAFAELGSDAVRTLRGEVRFVTDKRALYCANVDEEAVAEDNVHVSAVREYGASTGVPVIKVAARMEEELGDLPPEERVEFLESYGMTESALVQVIQGAYQALDLVSFFTVQSNQVQAWTVRRGTRAPQAAGVIHSDFEQGFIRAEVIAYDDLMKHGGETPCKAAGVARTEGKEYEVRDGDVIRFLFSAG